MRPRSCVPWPCALLVIAGLSSSASAAWNNVFQVTCFGCRNRPTVSNYAPAPVAAPAACCPQPTCTTQYVQRSYYQPVTTYKMVTSYEPVTTYQTSYYYEPVTSYRYSCYYDPCSCSYKQVATPVTSYSLKSQCCPVQSFVQRCQYHPVTSYQTSYYYEPVTTCNYPTSYTAPAPACDTPAPSAPAAAPAQQQQQPGVSEYRSPQQTQPPPAAVQEQRSTPSTQEPTNIERYYSPQNPPATRSWNRQWQPQAPVYPRPPAPAVAPPRVRLDRVAALTPADR